MSRMRLVIELDYSTSKHRDFDTVRRMVQNSVGGHPNLKFRRPKVLRYGRVVGAIKRSLNPCQP